MNVSFINCNMLGWRYLSQNNNYSITCLKFVQFNSTTVSRVWYWLFMPYSNQLWTWKSEQWEGNAKTNAKLRFLTPKRCQCRIALVVTNTTMLRLREKTYKSCNIWFMPVV